MFGSNRASSTAAGSKVCSCGHELFARVSIAQSIAVLEDDAEESKSCCLKKRFRSAFGRGCGFLVIAAILLFVVIDFACCGNLKGALDGALDYIESSGFVGILVFILIFVIATVILFPPVILTYGAGFAFSMCYGVIQGTIIGSIAVIIGAIIGSVISFTIGRYIIRDCVNRWVSKYKILKAIDIAVGSQGFKVSALLRLSPLIPFGVLNYLFAVTRISFKDFTYGTIGIIPGTIAFVLIGALSGSTVAMEDEEDESSRLTRLILFIVGGIATFVAIIYVGVHTKRTLKRTLCETQENFTDLCDFCAPYLDGYIESRSFSLTESEEEAGNP